MKMQTNDVFASIYCLMKESRGLTCEEYLRILFNMKKKTINRDSLQINNAEKSCRGNPDLFKIHFYFASYCETVYNRVIKSI